MSGEIRRIRKRFLALLLHTHFHRTVSTHTDINMYYTHITGFCQKLFLISTRISNIVAILQKQILLFLIVFTYSMQENDFKDFTEQNMQQHFRKHFRLDFPPGGLILCHLMETPLKEKSRIVRDGHLASIALFAIGFQGKEDFGEGEKCGHLMLENRFVI